MALFSTFLLSNIDSSLLFHYRFPNLRLELSIVIDYRWRYSLFFSFTEYSFTDFSFTEYRFVSTFSLPISNPAQVYLITFLRIKLKIIKIGFKIFLGR